MAYTHLQKDFKINGKPTGVAVVWLDQPGEKVNKLGMYVVEEFIELFHRILNDDEIKAVVVISRKEDTFIAGADLDVLKQDLEPGYVENMSRTGQEVLQMIADFPKPVVAAINGAALGGGLEVALACHYRIASDSPKTVLGLPEVQLGLLPGGRGTQTLPKLIGLQKALDLLVTGKNVYPRRARRIGLIDRITSPYALLEASCKAALKLIDKPMKRKPKISFGERLLESNPLTRGIIFKKARQMVMKQTMGNYPAPLKIIDVVAAGFGKGKKAGLRAEAQGFEDLSRTPEARQLINIFFGITAMKKNPLADKARPIHKIGIPGAGLMGAGIAQISAEKEYEVVLKDVDLKSLANGEKNIWKALNKKAKRKIISTFDRDRIFSRVSAVTEYSGFRKTDMIIEAVFEDLKLKHKILADCEAVAPEDCIFASNTSSLPISDIAAGARRPELVIGMHYFSPVPKMPLLEIVVTPKTAEWVTASAIAVGQRQGKTVIVVKDGPGFYTTRVLAVMLNEALLLLDEGGEIRQIDREMKKFGFPVGPFTLIDEVGIDVGAHVSEVLNKVVEKRGGQTTDVMEKMFAEGFLGRKNKKGFYHYHQKNGNPLLSLIKKPKEVNQNIYKFFGGSQRRKFEASEIQDRLAMILINEAARCLEEGILTSPRDGDIGAIMGIGFPPFLGGPFRHLDVLGAAEAVATFENLAKQFGARFQPADIIRQKAAARQKFYPD